MEIVESLSRRVKEAARLIKELQDERARMLNEIELLKLQLKAKQEASRENEVLKKTQDSVRSRLVKLQKKLEKQLILGIDMPPASATEAPYEEPVQ